ncbi:MAG: DinB family protein [Chloroflexi bacterium]|nr:DinB family protein [Chloroflexota bacterium]MCY3696603.1 DinB family protein [Chloroflexota bacterium]MXX81095.1 DinB family protein [Chloroflexota bacterium]MYF23444.1 DinB family protein [Chloroflexota bacterium]
MATNNIAADNSDSTERLSALVARLGTEDMKRPLGGGWTIGFALAHLAFWDARQVAALERVASGEPFPSEDLATNAALEAVADAFNPDTIGRAAVDAARQLDAVVETLTPDQVGALTGSGKSYAIARAPHREEHIRQIEDALG